MAAVLFTQSGCETLRLKVGGLPQANFISISDDVQAATLDTSYLSINAAGIGPAVDLIYQGANFGNNIRNVVFSLPAPVQSCIRHYGLANSRVDDICVNGSNCTQSVLYIAGGANVPWKNIHLREQSNRRSCWADVLRGQLNLHVVVYFLF